MTKNDSKQMYELCKQHMHAYVLAETVDGQSYDGIITGLDPEYVYLAVPLECHEMHNHSRYFGPQGFGAPFYPQAHPPRRFRRLVLPLAALTALTLLAWY